MEFHYDEFMSALQEEQLDRLFGALSDQTRRKMLLKLSKSEAQVLDLGRELGISKQLVSKHMKVLEGAGLVKKEKDGRIKRCQLNPQALEAAEKKISQYLVFWESQMDGLEKYIKKVKGSKE